MESGFYQHRTAHCFGKECSLNLKERTKKKKKRKKEKWTTHNFPRNGVSTAVWAGYWELAAARNVFLKEMRQFRTIF